MQAEENSDEYLINILKEDFPKLLEAGDIKVGSQSKMATQFIEIIKATEEISDSIKEKLINLIDNNRDEIVPIPKPSNSIQTGEMRERKLQQRLNEQEVKIPGISLKLDNDGKYISLNIADTAKYVKADLNKIIEAGGVPYLDYFIQSLNKNMRQDENSQLVRSIYLIESVDVLSEMVNNTKSKKKKAELLKKIDEYDNFIAVTSTKAGQQAAYIKRYNDILFTIPEKIIDKALQNLLYSGQNAGWSENVSPTIEEATRIINELFATDGGNIVLESIVEKRTEEAIDKIYEEKHGKGKLKKMREATERSLEKLDQFLKDNKMFDATGVALAYSAKAALKAAIGAIKVLENINAAVEKGIEVFKNELQKRNVEYPKDDSKFRDFLKTELEALKDDKLVEEISDEEAADIKNEEKAKDTANSLKRQKEKLNKILENPVEELEKIKQEAEENRKKREAALQNESEEIKNLRKEIEEKKKQIADIKNKLKEPKPKKEPKEKKSLEEKLKEKSEELDELLQDQDKAIEYLENKKQEAEKRKEKRENNLSEKAKDLQKKINAQKKLIDFLNKVDAVTPQKRKKVIADVLDIMSNFGYINNNTLMSIVAKAMGKNGLSAQDINTIFQGCKILQQYASLQNQYQQNPSPQLLQQIRNLSRQAAQAQKSIGAITVGENKSLISLMETIIKLNMLSAQTIVLSGYTNILTMMQRLLFLKPYDVLSRTYIRLGGAANGMPTFDNSRESMAVLGKRAITEAYYETFDNNATLKAYDAQTYFSPLESINSLISLFKGEKTQSGWDTLYDVINSTLGTPTVLISKPLTMTDAPFRIYVTEREHSKIIDYYLNKRRSDLLENTNRTALQDQELQDIENGTEHARMMQQKNSELADAAKKIGLRAVFQEDNPIASSLNSAFHYLDGLKKEMIEKGEYNGVALKTIINSARTLAALVRITQSPYLRMPLNFAKRNVSLALPIIPLVQAAYYRTASNNKNNPEEKAVFKRMSDIYFTEAVLGAVLHSIAVAFIEYGLVTGGDDEETAQEREMKKAATSPNPYRLNLSKTLRAVQYMQSYGFMVDFPEKNSNWEETDFSLTYNQLGSFGGVLATVVTARKYAEGKSDKIKSKIFNLLKISDEDENNEGMPLIFQNLAGYLTGAFHANLDIAALKGLNTALNAIFAKTADKAETAAERVYENAVSVLSSTISPAIISKIIQSYANQNVLKKTPDVLFKDDPVAYTVQLFDGVLSQKYGRVNKIFENKEMMPRVNIWGNPIPKIPEGVNPYLYGIFDFSKTSQNFIDRTSEKLLELGNEFQQRGMSNEDIAEMWPTPVKDIPSKIEDYDKDIKSTIRFKVGETMYYIGNNGNIKSIKITNELFSQYEQRIGYNRESLLLNAIKLSKEYNDDDETTVKVIKKAYQIADKLTFYQMFGSNAPFSNLNEAKKELRRYNPK
jgi:hypothetical protein